MKFLNQSQSLNDSIINLFNDNNINEKQAFEITIITKTYANF